MFDGSYWKIKSLYDLPYVKGYSRADSNTILLGILIQNMQQCENKARVNAVKSGTYKSILTYKDGKEVVQAFINLEIIKRIRKYILKRVTDLRLATERRIRREHERMRVKERARA